MKILERETNQVFKKIEIFLTVEEAEELGAMAYGLAEDPKTHHFHLETDEENGVCKKELVVAVYTVDNINEFDERSRKLILEDK